MIYGMYLSAAGVMANSHRQDVIANNLANAETTGFKRALSMVRQRAPESRESGRFDLSNPALDAIGGGIFLSPTQVDHSQGALESYDSPLSLAITGKGYFAVRDGDRLRLTRNGIFPRGARGELVMSDGTGRKVLDVRQRPIRIDVNELKQIAVGDDGTITKNGEFIAQIGVFDVPDQRQLVPAGGTLMAVDEAAIARVINPSVQSGYVELANVDPAIELTQLMEAQRQLEANANMIRYQDQTLGRLVNDVGKIG